MYLRFMWIYSNSQHVLGSVKMQINPHIITLFCNFWLNFGFIYVQHWSSEQGSSAHNFTLNLTCGLWLVYLAGMLTMLCTPFWSPGWLPACAKLILFQRQKQQTIKWELSHKLWARIHFNINHLFFLVLPAEVQGHLLASACYNDFQIAVAVKAAKVVEGEEQVYICNFRPHQKPQEHHIADVVVQSRFV